jgi:hypothetical protein
MMRMGDLGCCGVVVLWAPMLGKRSCLGASFRCGLSTCLTRTLSASPDVWVGQT